MTAAACCCCPNMPRYCLGWRRRQYPRRRCRWRPSCAPGRPWMAAPTSSPWQRWPIGCSVGVGPRRRRRMPAIIAVICHWRSSACGCQSAGMVCWHGRWRPGLKRALRRCRSLSRRCVSRYCISRYLRVAHGAIGRAGTWRRWLCWCCNWAWVCGLAWKAEELSQRRTVRRWLGRLRRGEVFGDRQDKALELGVFLEADGFVEFMGDLVVDAGGHAQTHGVGLLGHLLGGLDQAVGHQLAACILANVDVVENPHALERQRGEARIELAEAKNLLFIIGHGQVDHRFLAADALFQKFTRGVGVGQLAKVFAVIDEQWRELIQMLQGRLDDAHGEPLLKVMWMASATRQRCLRTTPMLPKAFGKCNPNKRLVVVCGNFPSESAFDIGR